MELAEQLRKRLNHDDYVGNEYVIRHLASGHPHQALNMKRCQVVSVV